jgi:hypothetical protein
VAIFIEAWLFGGFDGLGAVGLAIKLALCSSDKQEVKEI